MVIEFMLIIIVAWIIVSGQAYHDVLACDPVHTDKHFPSVPGVNGPDDMPDASLLASLELIKDLNLVPVNIHRQIYTLVRTYIRREKIVCVIIYRYCSKNIF